MATKKRTTAHDAHMQGYRTGMTGKGENPFKRSYNLSQEWEKGYNEANRKFKLQLAENLGDRFVYHDGILYRDGEVYMHLQLPGGVHYSEQIQEAHETGAKIATLLNKGDRT